MASDAKPDETNPVFPKDSLPSTAAKPHPAGEASATQPEIDRVELTPKQLAVFAAKSQSYRGPLPPAEAMKGYEDTLPGSADRIMKMAENEQTHRHQLDGRALQAAVDDDANDRSERRRGQIFALLIGFGALTSSTLVAIVNPSTGGSVVAGIIGGGGIVGLVSAFLINRSQPTTQDVQAADESEMEETAAD